MSSKLRIAIDAMGGDRAPAAAVHGAVEAARLSRGRCTMVLVGDEQVVKKELERHFRVGELDIEVVHAPEQVDMHESPAQAVRQKKNSSIAVAMRLHKEGQVDAVVGAGHTGVMMATALLTLGRMPGVQRPAIGTVLPTLHGRVLLLDVGANSDCKPSHLYQFGVMGSVFMSGLFDLEQPRVGLLSIGEESTKGSELVLQAHRLLAQSQLNFIGNVEGGDILRDVADVVVTDGFTGNVILKFAESVEKLYSISLRRKIGRKIFSLLGAWLLKPTFRHLKEVFDYQQYGGAPLLGVRGTVIICHGKSTPKAIRNAVKEARKMIESGVNEHIAARLREWSERKGGKKDDLEDSGNGARRPEETAHER